MPDQSGQSAATDNDQFSVTPPSLILPKGGGALRGIGEKFAANLVTGTGSMSVPLSTSTGRAGFGPSLSLSYDSSSGAGPFGLGWNLALATIARKTEQGLPKYRDADESDVFTLTGTEDLVPVLTKDANGKWVPEPAPPRVVGGATYRIQRYRPRIEGLFARIERWTNEADRSDSFWRSISSNNITTWYGRNDESRITDPADRTRIFSWLLCESTDGKGNVIVYRYKPEDSQGVDASQLHERNRTDATRRANRYPKRILYGNHAPYLPRLSSTQPWPAPPGATSQDGSADWFFEIAFDYGEHDEGAPTPTDEGAWSVRPDPFSSSRAGFDIRTYRLCQRVLMFHHFEDETDVGLNCLVRSTDFAYSTDNTPADPRGPVHSTLLSVSHCGYQRQPVGYLKRSLPPVDFEYTQVEIDDSIKEVDADSVDNLPYGLDGVRYQWVDVDGEGLSGILTEQGGAWFYKRNLSTLPVAAPDGTLQTTARFAPIERVQTLPSPARVSGGQQFLDLAGDGLLDAVSFDARVPGFFERTPNGEWDTFTPFVSVPNIAWNDPNLRLVDLTGDGRPDILLAEDEVLTWYPSLGEEGFGPPEMMRQAFDEEAGPRLVISDGTQSIYLADMSGDGLADLVRIRNGEVSYWPNLGYGRFGAKTTMDAAPWFDAPDRFDQKRIRLADIDGSGTIDILYLADDRIHLYFNRSGNGWSAPRTLGNVPRGDSFSSVTTVDLLGNGTACLVWSSSAPGEGRAPMRYIDLMGGQKPHLLIRTFNNLGGETEVTYAPSTKFYLADRLAGTPWITRLPFPVHVVEKVAVRDKWRQTEFVSTYSYHHGYFDGVEREFRGFGKVERVDVQSFDTFSSGNALSPYVTDDQTLYQPPVKTISWHHTGALVDREHTLSQFSSEYLSQWFETCPAWCSDPVHRARLARTGPGRDGSLGGGVARSAACLQRHAAAPGSVRTGRRRAAYAQRTPARTPLLDGVSQLSDSTAPTAGGESARRVPRHRERGDHVQLRARSHAG